MSDHAQGLLRLRRGVIVAEDPLTVEIDGEHRRAWADTDLLGEMKSGDEVIVNVAALDLKLGSGGFDIVHVNLTRGLDAPARDDSHVIKLNYTSLQHPVDPVEPPAGAIRGARVPVLAISPHGHLAPAVWAASRVNPDLKIGYVQVAGGALPGSFSRDVAELRERGLLCGHITVSPAYGGEFEAISMVGALDAAVNGDPDGLGWDAVVIGPGPGILGSATPYGHGAMVVLEALHSALVLDLPAILSPRLSSSDPRPRHRGLSHHTRTVLDLLLGSVKVAAPYGEAGEGELLPTGPPDAGAVETSFDELTAICGGRHQIEAAPVDLAAYAESGLPTKTMGRSIEEDPLFFAAPLAAGTVLAGQTHSG